MFNFEKLGVWQKAIVLADVIYGSADEIGRMPSGLRASLDQR
jgi:hypothetical protein